MTLSRFALALSCLLVSAFFSTTSFAESKVDAGGTTVSGFFGGNDFEFTSAIGEVSVYCPQQPGYPPRGPQSAYFRCFGYIFAPTESAQFRGLTGNYDEVELIATHEDGSVTKMTSPYDGPRGRSMNGFNLWVETTFQRALLRLGRNIIDWSLLKRGQMIETGTFFSHVVEKRDLQCPAVNQTSWDPNDCIQSNRVCADYFRNFGRQCR